MYIYTHTYIYIYVYTEHTNLPFTEHQGNRTCGSSGSWQTNTSTHDCALHPFRSLSCLAVHGEADAGIRAKPSLHHDEGSLLALAKGFATDLGPILLTKLLEGPVEEVEIRLQGQQVPAPQLVDGALNKAKEKHCSERKKRGSTCMLSKMRSKNNL